MAKATCPQCGKQFTPWRAKTYCSEKCRKRAENARLGYVWGDEATPIANSPNSENLPKKNQRVANPFRGDEGFEWLACNEVTHKLTQKGSPDAIGWAMLVVAGHGWFGRIGKEFSFGPTSLNRARSAVEARLLGQLFDKLEGEKSWSGTCWRPLSGLEAARANLAEARERLTSLGRRSDVGGGDQHEKLASDDLAGLMPADGGEGEI